MPTKTLRASHAGAVLRFLEKHQIPYQVQISTATDKVTAHVPKKGKTVWLCSQSHLKKSELGFIAEVRKAALASRTKPQWNSPQSINYYRFRDLAPGDYTNVAEIDVNSAYGQIAYYLGIIDKATAEKMKTVSKQARLVALGALASRPTVYQWQPGPDGGTKTKIEQEYTEEDEVLRSYFFDIAKYLDEIMNGAIHQHEVLFYWVDAFFCMHHAADSLYLELAKHGLSAKHKPMKSLSIRRAKNGMRCAFANMVEGDPKPFFFGNPEEKAQYHLNQIANSLKSL